MSYMRLLTDRCDIYKLKPETTAGKYGMPDQTTLGIGQIPDYSNVASLFVKTGTSGQLNQEEPNQVIDEQYLVHFPISVDIQINDRVIWNGNTYRAKLPRKIRGHHIEVEVFRSDSL